MSIDFDIDVCIRLFIDVCLCVYVLNEWIYSNGVRCRVDIALLFGDQILPRHNDRWLFFLPFSLSLSGQPYYAETPIYRSNTHVSNTLIFAWRCSFDRWTSKYRWNLKKAHRTHDFPLIFYFSCSTFNQTNRQMIMAHVNLRISFRSQNRLHWVGDGRQAFV